MDIFYQELNKEPKYNNKDNVFNYDDYLNKSNYMINKINNYENDFRKKNEKQNNLNNEININQIINDKSSQKTVNIFPIKEIIIFKQYIKNMTKEEMNSLPYNVQNELKEIYEILNEKLNN